MGAHPGLPDFINFVRQSTLHLASVFEITGDIAFGVEFPGANQLVQELVGQGANRLPKIKYEGRAASTWLRK
jgi:hypothetical protein